MRFSVSLGWLGYALDFSVGPMCDDEPEYPSTEVPEFEPYQDAGSTGSWPISFTRPAVPWEDPGSLHQFDPDDDGENP